jgi:hypothetical protein
MENTIRTDVMDAISNIDDVVTESDLSVISSMIESFDKASVILENYNGDDVEMFNIFQEADNGKENPFKEKNAFWTVVKFIPNLVKLIIDKIKKAFGKEEQTKTQQVINSIKNAPQETKDFISNIMESAAKFIADKTGMEEGTAEKVVTIMGISVPVGVAGALLKKADDAIEHGAGLIQRLITASGKAPANPGNAKYVFHKYTKGKRKDTWSSSIDLDKLLENAKQYNSVITRYIHAYVKLDTPNEQLVDLMNAANKAYAEIDKSNYFVIKPIEYTDDKVEAFIKQLTSIMAPCLETCEQLQTDFKQFSDTGEFTKKNKNGEYDYPKDLGKALKESSETSVKNMQAITKYIIGLSNLKHDLDIAFQKANAVVDEGGSILQKIKNGATDLLDKAKSKFKKDDDGGTEDTEASANSETDKSTEEVSDNSNSGGDDESSESAGGEEEVTEEYDTSWYNR